MVYGGVEYVLGYPTWESSGGIQTEHVTEAGGRPIPIASLVVANFAASGESTYSASYINAGFSGGAVVFPLADDDWTIAGIVTHFPTIKRSVYRGGVKTGDYVSTTYWISGLHFASVSLGSDCSCPIASTV